MMKSGLIFILSLLLILSATAQDGFIEIDDTTTLNVQKETELFQEVSDLDPKRAALLSAIFPGLGQAYNKQYWKVPLVWAGVLTFGHFINYNNKVYHALRNAALLTSKGQTNPYESIISSETSLVRGRDVFRRNRDLLIIVGTAFYILQIVDAHVSAHLEEFKVNDKLSFGIKPSIQPTPLFSQAVGVSFVLKF